jgi:hypothetical protein
VAKAKEPVNPFYLLLVVLGIVFLITACAYTVTAYRAISPAAGRDVGSHELTAFLDHYGLRMLTGELVLLAAATFGAMWLDRFRARQNRGESPEDDGDAD